MITDEYIIRLTILPIRARPGLGMYMYVIVRSSTFWGFLPSWSTMQRLMEIKECRLKSDCTSLNANCEDFKRLGSLRSRDDVRNKHRSVHTFVIGKETKKSFANTSYSYLRRIFRFYRETASISVMVIRSL